MEHKKRKRRILPRIPKELESSRTSLERSYEEGSTEPARESSSSSTTTTTRITTELTSTWNVVITHPTQSTFTCLACGVSYHVYSSLQRHMLDQHKDEKVMWTYVCAMCGKEFSDKKKVSAHVNRMHTGMMTTKKDPKGERSSASSARKHSNRAGADPNMAGINMGLPSWPVWRR